MSLAIALLMGMVYFFVPFAGILGRASSEALIFAIAIASTVVAITMHNSIKKGKFTRRK